MNTFPQLIKHTLYGARPISQNLGQQAVYGTSTFQVYYWYGTGKWIISSRFVRKFNHSGPYFAPVLEGDL